MRLIIISLSALFLSLILVIGGNAFLLSLVGIRLGESGVEPSQIGLILTAYSIGFVLGAIFTPKLLMRVGHIRAFAALASITAMAAISYPISDSLIHWAALRLIGGFSVAGLFIAIESWFSAVASDNNRATLFSLYQVAAYSAAAVGQLLLDINPSQGNFIAFTLAGLLLIAAIIPLSASKMQSPPLDETTAMSLRTLLRQAPIGVMGALCGGVLLGGFYALVPVFGSLVELERGEIAQLMFLSVLTAMLFAWPIGWLCDRFPRSEVLIVVLLLGVFAAISIVLIAHEEFYWLCLASGVLMAMIAAIYSISVAITNDLIVSEQRVAAASTLMLSYGVGSIAGPLLGSLIMQSFHPNTLYLGFAIVLAGLVMFTRYRQMQKPPLPVDEQEQFIPAMPETQVNAEFDPRTEDLPDTPIEELFPDEVSDDLTDEVITNEETTSDSSLPGQENRSNRDTLGS